MYVCICNAVTEKQIRKAIADGAETVAQLRDQLQVTGCCGMCLDSVQACLQPPLLQPEATAA